MQTKELDEKLIKEKEVPIPDNKEPELTPDEIQVNAAKAILEQGIEFDVTVNIPTILHRIGLLKLRKTFKIYPIKLGALLQIAKEINSISIDFKDDETVIEATIETIINNKDKLVKVAAIAILNRKCSKYRIYFLHKYLDRNLSASELLKIYNLVTQQMGITDFLASILSVKGMNIMKTKANQSKETEGNTSISGKQSDRSLNTSDSDGKKSSGDEVGKI